MSHEIQREGNEVPIYDDKAHVRGKLDISNAEWITSTEDDDQKGVEIAFVEEYILMRNGADPEGPVLVFTQAEWDAFVEGAKDGEFDEP
ncbi:DUF397 domain-containing protein [Actinoalloteichus sp. AHMU CJ021]|uniref:DUF397 domain-containing protein n=1 Tax=Actinoalloteichus caeruleus DSM 43889 TaxID=1120930 RepID=A0ABT1JIT8_ACTCY|nr:DUF397 domain-containing protein [Actinoalloteichus caeruleus]AUS78078.1 DUF397 domain-containing protein [Actinoalloteichus sp. AHMU CJ021]MCP2332071.1 protein of unknown function (DUF397) [Actinoalloteichus caeruleus DSM 43889]